MFGLKNYRRKKIGNSCDKKIMEENKKLGARGERLVADYLIKKEFTLLAYNYKWRFGEIDLIAQKEDLLAFVEVKLRQTTYFNLSEIITYDKQQKIIFTAKHYIFMNKLWNFIYRFDVALLEHINDNYNINYIANAFTESEFT